MVNYSNMARDPIVLKKVFVHNLKGIDLTLDPGAIDRLYRRIRVRKIFACFRYHLRRRTETLYRIALPSCKKIFGRAAQAPGREHHRHRSDDCDRAEIRRQNTALDRRHYDRDLDYLRVLFARVGIPHCPVSKEKVAAQSREKIISALFNIQEGTKLYRSEPLCPRKKEENSKKISPI